MGALSCLGVTYLGARKQCILLRTEKNEHSVFKKPPAALDGAAPRAPRSSLRKLHTIKRYFAPLRSYHQIQWDPCELEKKYDLKLPKHRVEL